MALFPANSESWSPGGPLPRPLENGGASWDNPQTQLLHGVVKSWTRLSDSTTAALPRDKVLSSESQLEAETEAGAGCLRGVSTDTSSLANGVTAGVCVCACVCVCVCGLDHSQKAASGSLRQSAFSWPFRRSFQLEESQLPCLFWKQLPSHFCPQKRSP